MKFKRHTKLKVGDLDIAPLVDVVFQLLIFFMLTSSFIFQPGIKVNLPKAVTSEVLGEKNIIITVTGENLIYFNGKSVTIKELDVKLKAFSEEGEDRPLLIRADKRSSLGRVVEVWDTCRKLGITRVNVATNQAVE